MPSPLIIDSICQKELVPQSRPRELPSLAPAPGWVSGWVVGVPIPSPKNAPLSPCLQVEHSSLGQRGAFLVKRGGLLHGYRNWCPHIGLPLNMFPDRFWNFDQQFLNCTTTHVLPCHQNPPPHNYIYEFCDAILCRLSHLSPSNSPTPHTYLQAK